MSELNLLAVMVAAVVAFATSTAWYIAFAEQLTAPSAVDPEGVRGNERPPVWKVLVEMVRSLVVAIGLALAAEAFEVEGWAQAVLLGLAAWATFPAVILSGSVLWKEATLRVAAVHAGDWLVKLVVLAAIVGVWR